jgi:hypothetical protein
MKIKINKAGRDKVREKKEIWTWSRISMMMMA